MFGLEKQGKEFKYELETDLQGPNGAAKLSEIKKLISSRIEDLKGLLRKIEDKEEFSKTETLLHGYMSFQKVVDKIVKK